MAAPKLFNNTSLSSSTEYADNSTTLTSTYGMIIPEYIPNNPVCSAKENNFFCDIISSSLQTQEESDRIDLSNMDESGWIWTSFGVFAPLCLFGIIGNILTIIMFSKYIKKTTTSVFIIALAMVDLLVCSISMPIYLYTLLNEYHGSETLCKADKLVYFMAIPLSAGILLVIAIDRFLLIFLVKTNIVTRFRAKLTVFILGLVCLAIAIPQALSFTTMYTLDERLTSSRCTGSVSCNTLKCRPTTEFISREVWYYLFQSLVIAFLVMVIAFSTIYSLIFAKVYSLHHKMMGWKKSQNSTDGNHSKIHGDPATFSSVNLSLENPENGNNNDQNYNRTVLNPQVIPKKKKKPLPHLHTARTLFLVTSCFILAYAPLILMMFLRSCESKEENSFTDICGRNDHRRFLWHFYFLHHIINPIIYSFMNPRFREAIRKCVKTKCCVNSDAS